MQRHRLAALQRDLIGRNSNRFAVIEISRGGASCAALRVRSEDGEDRIADRFIEGLLV